MLAYDTDALMAGAGVAAQVSSAVSGSGASLSAAAIGPGAFGRVGKAASLAATIGEVHRRQTQRAQTVAGNAEAAGVRLRAAAHLGGQLSVDTVCVASGLRVSTA